MATAADVQARGQLLWCLPGGSSMPHIASESLDNFFPGLKLLVEIPADARPQPYPSLEPAYTFLLGAGVG